eukprot:gnl/MRDRNA2_/MRDRNA2_100971_c0_seq1.p1 gnl/MRDRNA2_/MRDRNA2_100971_c0~~gnl/MRDRNA2_/MRDRNA2_100971_c0_seq1.p1  ORF type:complete len:211 (+),score=36.95 gnl/MRDRNA2_/MRDRNA2_100971_c0_seq1:97-729(+)
MGISPPSQLLRCTSCCKATVSNEVRTKKYWDRVGEFDRRAIALAEALHDEDWRIRETAVRGFGPLEHAAVPFCKDIAAMMNDESWQVRRAAIRALGELGAVAVEHSPAIVLALNDVNPHVRVAAAETLHKVRTTLSSNFAARQMQQESRQEPLWMMKAAVSDLVASRNYKLGVFQEDDDPGGYWAYFYHLGHSPDVDVEKSLGTQHPTMF